MYGKVFSTMFDGSMMGSGPWVFSVWTYAIANADAKGYVELNPKLIAAKIAGKLSDSPEVQTALDVLCAEDPDSRSKDEGGRRLVKEGEFLYRIVNYGTYRAIRDKEERREYMRTYMRSKRSLGDVSHGKPPLAHGEVEGEVEGEEPLDIYPFDLFWTHYPKKAGKADAKKAWARLTPDERSKAIAAAIPYAAAMAGRTEFVKNAQGWLNGRRWEDDPSSWKAHAPSNGGSPSGNQRLGGGYADPNGSWFDYRGERYYKHKDNPDAPYHTKDGYRIDGSNIFTEPRMKREAIKEMERKVMAGETA